MDERFITEDGVRTTLKTEYSLETDIITPLGSYFNINFIAEVKNVEENNGEKRKYIVKIFNVTNASYFKNAELQYVLMQHLHLNNVKTSVQIPTLTGKPYVTDGDRYMFQLLTFLPGQSIKEAQIKPEELNKLFFKVGVHMARFHENTKTLQYNNSNLSPDFPFLPENALIYLSRLSYVENMTTRQTIRKHMDLYKKNFLSRTNELRRGFIHGDFSDTNVIISKQSSNKADSKQEWVVSGVIDFEHCHYGYLIGDLGISIAYFMTKAVSTPNSNIIESAKEIIRGYQSVRIITAVEKEVLFDVVTSRLGFSYISGCYESYLHPEKKEIIMLQSKYMPTVFEIIDSVGRSKIEHTWFGK